MTVSNLKELEQLLKLCHKQQVRTITIDGMIIALELTMPEPKSESDVNAKPAIEYTDEQLLTWSAN